MSPAVLRAEAGLLGAVLQEVSRHPVILAGACEVLDRLAEVPAMQLGAAFARRADQDHGKALVVGHRDERGLAEPRHALDADLLRVHGLVGLEVVETARGAPGPGAQRAPIVRTPALALVDQADDAFGQSRAVVGLDAARGDRRVAPTVGDQLLGRGRILQAAPVHHLALPAPASRAEAAGGRRRCARSGRHPGSPAEHHHHRHRLRRAGGRHDASSGSRP